MNIALDYDDTYTADPELWDDFCRMASDRGHHVYVVTCRPEKLSPLKEDLYVPMYSEDVFCTNHKAKRPFMEEEGINIDIWIDDSPEYIVEDRE